MIRKLSFVAAAMLNGIELVDELVYMNYILPLINLSGVG